MCLQAPLEGLHNNFTTPRTGRCVVGLRRPAQAALAPRACLTQPEASVCLSRPSGTPQVFFNCTILMIMFGMCGYFMNVVPGCVGAGRKERIPHYFRRSMLIVSARRRTTQCVSVPRAAARYRV